MEKINSIHGKSLYTGGATADTYGDGVKDIIMNPLVKSPQPVDLDVGRKIRARRLQIGMSQADLGTQLGLTFQQVQKYEKGVNRITASRLVDISKALRVPSIFFLPTESNSSSAVDDAYSLLAVNGASQWLESFARIKNNKMRHAILAVAIAAQEER